MKDNYGCLFQTRITNVYHLLSETDRDISSSVLISSRVKISPEFIPSIMDSCSWLAFCVTSQQVFSIPSIFSFLFSVAFGFSSSASVEAFPARFVS